MKKKYSVSISVSLLLTLISCQADQKTAEAVVHYVKNIIVNQEVITPLFTPVSLIMYYEDQLEECQDDFDQMIIDIHKACDRDTTYFDRTNIKTVNDAYGTNQPVSVSDDLFNILKIGIEMTKLTKGKFNLAMGSLIDAWGNSFALSSFPGEDIDASLIEKALTSIPNYEIIDQIIVLNEEDKTVIFNELPGAQENVVISLGGLAKGYAVDKARDYLQKKGYPGIVSAGSSSLATIGENPLKDRDYWGIAVRSPLLYYQVDTAFLLQLEGTNNLSTSGDYEQNFLIENEDGTTTIRHHILDPDTGYSANYHRAVTLYSANASSALLDALSTAMMNYETSEEIFSILNAVNQYYGTSIQYGIFNSYQDSLSEFSVMVSQDFSSSLADTISAKIKEIYVK